MCCDEALPSDECELPEDGAAGCGAIGGRNAAAGCVNGNGTGSGKPSDTGTVLLFKAGKCRLFS